MVAFTLAFTYNPLTADKCSTSIPTYPPWASPPSRIGWADFRHLMSLSQPARLSRYELITIQAFGCLGSSLQSWTTLWTILKSWHKCLSGDTILCTHGNAFQFINTECLWIQLRLPLLYYMKMLRYIPYIRM